MLIKAEAAFKKADDIWSLRKDDYFVNDEARARYWDDREKARLALEAARKKAEQQSQQEKNAQQQSDTEASRLKYTEEAQSLRTAADAAGEIYRPSGRTEQGTEGRENPAGRLQHADGGGEKGL
ncbi:hypothetical protein [Escherichia coli]|uniref:hypothetical protein n=1 Tax=Escherichia coli TaxID=562 RepID=UPI00398126EE